MPQRGVEAQLQGQEAMRAATEAADASSFSRPLAAPPAPVVRPAEWQRCGTAGRHVAPQRGSLTQTLEALPVSDRGPGTVTLRQPLTASPTAGAVDSESWATLVATSSTR